MTLFKLQITNFKLKSIHLSLFMSKYYLILEEIMYLRSIK